MDADLPKVLSDNVKALLGEVAGGEKPTAALVRLGIGNGHATRLLKGQTDHGIRLVGKLAEVFKVQPWQLLVPGFDPKQPPLMVAAGSKPGWPFDFAADRFEALREKERGMVEYAARTELERIEQERKRREPAAAVVQTMLTPTQLVGPEPTPRFAAVPAPAAAAAPEPSPPRKGGRNDEAPSKGAKAKRR